MLFHIWPKFWKWFTTPKSLRRLPSRKRRRQAQHHYLHIEQLESRTLLSSGTVLPNDLLADLIQPAGEIDTWTLTLADAGRVTAEVQAAGFDTRLTLQRADGSTLIQSDGQSLLNQNDLISQYLEPGTYIFQVEGLNNGTGNYSLSTRFETGIVPYQNLPLPANPSSIVAADFNNDGQMDLAVTSQDAVTPQGYISVYLNQPGGGYPAFTTKYDYLVGYLPAKLMVGDFNGDGNADLATENDVLLGNGNGTMQAPVNYAMGVHSNLVIGDFNNDNRDDIAASNSTEIHLYSGWNVGAFQNYDLQSGGDRAMLIGDFNQDGKLDIVSMMDTGSIGILLGNGNGTLQAYQEITTVQTNTTWSPITSYSDLAVAGDFNGDGNLDLAVAEFIVGGHNIKVLLGNGNGTFQPGIDHQMINSADPYRLKTADITGDGILDVTYLMGDAFSSGWQVVQGLTGRGNGNFDFTSNLGSADFTYNYYLADFDLDGKTDIAVPNTVGGGSLWYDGATTYQIFQSVEDPDGKAVVADFTGDGLLDLAFASYWNADISFNINRAGRMFLDQPVQGVDGEPKRLVSDDFNRDGLPDLAVTSEAGVSVFLGRIDGTYQDAVLYSAGNNPMGLVSGDFNNDGRMDLATADYAGALGGVYVLLGLGDGRFQDGYNVAAGFARNLATGDVNGDGFLDLAVASYGDNKVSLLLGRGDGSFLPAQQIALTGATTAEEIALVDTNGDQFLDIVVTNYSGPGISVLRGNGDGTFQANQNYDAGVVSPMTVLRGLVSGDFNHDGFIDLVTGNLTMGPLTISTEVLLGNAAGTFTRQSYANGVYSIGPAGDFNGDGHLDLLGQGCILFGRGDGTFQAPQLVLDPNWPNVHLTTVTDINHDQNLDVVGIAGASTGNEDVVTWLGFGDGSFIPQDSIVSAFHNTPLSADINGDGTMDLAVLNEQGEILVRYDQPGASRGYAAAVVVNSDPALAARDLAIVNTSSGVALAALDFQNSGLSVYTRDANGNYQRSASLTVPSTFPAKLAAGDLNGDGRDDLVVATDTDKVLVYYQNAQGGFAAGPNLQMNVGATPSDLALTDMDGDGRRDIVVSNRDSGDVSVLLNDLSNTFVSQLRYRAVDGLYGTQTSEGLLQPSSATGQSLGLVTGRFNNDSAMDVISINRGLAEGFSVLLGNGAEGGLLNPQSALTYSTGGEPAIIISGRFNADGYDDLAILNKDSNQIQVFTADGNGGFTLRSTADAGLNPNGLSTRDVDGDGKLDLLVGNKYGDVLVLSGNGDGTFQPYRRVGRSVPLAIADLDGNGRDDFIMGNESLDRVSVQFGGSIPNLFRDRGNGILAPDAVKLADLNSDGINDLVVANSGSNNVLVYLGTGAGQFDAGRSFFAGSNPTGLTVADVNADGRLDLVTANKGSNDVSILFGQGTGAGWTTTYGPRLDTGGQGPVSAVVQDINNDQVLDILVSNSTTHDVSLLYGVGGGFFNDQNPVRTPVGTAPGLLLSVSAPTGPAFVTLNYGSNSVTLLSGYNGTNFQTQNFSSGGLRPVAAAVTDYNADGLSDLLVANNGDGVISLLSLNGDGQFVEAGRFSNADAPNPSAIGLSALDDGRFYLTSDGVENVISCSLTDFFQPADDNPSDPGSERRGQVVAFVPMEESPLAMVATLVPGESDADGLADIQSTSSSNFGDLLSLRTGSGYGMETEATANLRQLIDLFDETYHYCLSRIHDAYDFGMDALLELASANRQMLDSIVGPLGIKDVLGDALDSLGGGLSHAGSEVFSALVTTLTENGKTHFAADIRATDSAAPAAVFQKWQIDPTHVAVRASLKLAGQSSSSASLALDGLSAIFKQFFQQINLERPAQVVPLAPSNAERRSESNAGEAGRTWLTMVSDLSWEKKAVAAVAACALSGYSVYCLRGLWQKSWQS